MSAPQPAQSAASSGSRAMIPILVGAVAALLASSVYMATQLNQLRDDLDAVRRQAGLDRQELAQTREELRTQVARLHESSAASTEVNKTTIEALKKQVDAARRQAGTAVGEAQIAAAKRADELTARLETLQQEQAQQVAAVSEKVSQVKSDADATRSQVGEVSSEVGNVKTQLTATKSDLEKAIETLRTARGDLDGQSVRVAANAKELEALRAQGERIYTSFSLPKEKNPRKVADIQLRLTAVDLKKNSYTVEVIFDDKKVEKKDKTVNEPLQFYSSRSKDPYEVVVNEVKKDLISGYVSAPKTPQVTR